MNFKQLIADDDAVSPVIGVILMVAITVILAAVIGTFVLGLGDQVQNNAPSAQFSFEYTDNGDDGNDELQVIHESGPTVDAARLTATIEGEQAYCTDGTGSNCDGASSGGTYSADYAPASSTEELYTNSGDVNSGTSSTIETGDQFTTSSGTYLSTSPANDKGYLDLSEATVRVIWTSESGDSTDTLRRWDGPSA